jgi:hypothetical protein
VPTAYRAFLLIDSYLYGFIMQEANWPSDEGEMAQVATFVTSQSPQAGYPALVEAMSYVMIANPQNSRFYDAEFEHGLDMILDGLERARRDAVGTGTAIQGR